MADYSGGGVVTSLNTTVHTYHHTNNARIRRLAQQAMLRHWRAEQKQRRLHDRLVKARKARERAAKEKARKARIAMAKAKAERLKRNLRIAKDVLSVASTVAVIGVTVASGGILAPLAVAVGFAITSEGVSAYQYHEGFIDGGEMGADSVMNGIDVVTAGLGAGIPKAATKAAELIKAGKLSSRFRVTRAAAKEASSMCELVGAGSMFLSTTYALGDLTR